MEGLPPPPEIKKVMGMLNISLWDVNGRFWSRLGCLGQKVTIFAHSVISLCTALIIRAVHKEICKKCSVCLVWTTLGVGLSLSPTHIGLPLRFNNNLF